MPLESCISWRPRRNSRQETAVPGAGGRDALMEAYRELGGLGRQGYGEDALAIDQRLNPILGKDVCGGLYAGTSWDPGHDHCLFSLNYDLDGDGREELLVGYGVSPGRVTVLAYYTVENGEYQHHDGLKLLEEEWPIPGTAFGPAETWDYICDYNS